jgi:hypothetical protein
MTLDQAVAAMRQAFARDVKARRRSYFPRGRGWDQITDAEREVFQIPVAQVPLLAALHEYCLAFHKTDLDDDQPYRGLRPLPFRGSPAYKVVKRDLNARLDLRSRTPQLETFLKVGALLGVPARLAHAWWHKDVFWELRAEFAAFIEPPLHAANRDEDEIPF